MTLAERKGAELAGKSAGLIEELDHWLAISEPGGQLEKHSTQIRAITRVLRLSMPALDGRDDEDEEALFASAASLERRLLALHRIWDFFRAKLALRYVPWFADYLMVADEFAWSCYQPAQARIADDLGKEPPLVYLNGGASPLTLPRGSGWLAEEVPGEQLRAERLEEALRELPIPVIGVPWFHARHFPDAPVIGHEVGHDVERDLQLTETMHRLVDVGLVVAGTGPHRSPAWRAWASELFADIYATLAGGPAYVATLSDFLGAPRYRVEEEWRSGAAWGSYPTRTLRVLACTSVLDRIGLGDEAEPLRSRWTSTYQTNAMEEYERDVPDVVAALVDGAWPELGKAPLTSLMTFTREMQDVVTTGADLLLRGQLPRTRDVRATVAAARAAYDRDPVRYVTSGCATWTIQHIAALQQAGPRSSGDTAPPERDRDARDRRSVERLARVLERPHITDHGEEDDE